MAVDTHILPKMGYGTWTRRGRNGQRSVEEALEIGYRHIDTAQGYGFARVSLITEPVQK